jgi:hypothetical protein
MRRPDAAHSHSILVKAGEDVEEPLLRGSRRSRPSVQDQRDMGKAPTTGVGAADSCALSAGWRA